MHFTEVLNGSQSVYTHTDIMDKISSFSQRLELPLTSGWHLHCLLSFWQCQTMITDMNLSNLPPSITRSQWGSAPPIISLWLSLCLSFSLSMRCPFDSGSRENSYWNKSSSIWVTSIARVAAVTWQLYCTLVVEEAKFKVITLTNKTPFLLPNLCLK